jgi:hypothetical protein
MPPDDPFEKRSLSVPVPSVSVSVSSVGEDTAAGLAEREKSRISRNESAGAKWTFLGVVGVRRPSSSL